MRVSGLTVLYKGGVNTVLAAGCHQGSGYPVGDLLCRIFQGETLYNISSILRNCIDNCPLNEKVLTQDSIEQAEDYVLQALLYDDFYPAQALAQGSFIRGMEYYRSLCSETAIGLLEQEQLRAANVPDLFRDIGYGNVGQYLRLCFNSYYVDLINALGFFSVMAAVKSGTADHEEQGILDSFLNAFKDPDAVPGIEMQTIFDQEAGGFHYRYIISSFLSMVLFEFTHIEESAVKVVRCQNPACGRFFTARRSSAQYCGFPSPQAPSRTCGEYYPQHMYREKLRENELDRLVKNASSRLYMDRRRHPEAGEELFSLITELQEEASEKKKSVMDKTMTITQFKEWLNSLRRKKGDTDYV